MDKARQWKGRDAGRATGGKDGVGIFLIFAQDAWADLGGVWRPGTGSWVVVRAVRGREDAGTPENEARTSEHVLA